ncbi:MAG: hypothetical protein WD696_19580 [Bryobacteraceae bacterium]
MKTKIHRAVISCFFTVLGLQAADFEFPVSRERLWKDEPGRIRIDESGVAYDSTDGKTQLRLPFKNIREADVSDPKVIRLETYDRLKARLGSQRVHRFRLRQRKHGEDLAWFLTSKLNRPVVGAYALQSEVPFKVSAYHRHRIGGCHGEIQIGPDGVRFASEKEGDSRTWRYDEIETTGYPDPFHFRVTSFAETYTFELKERLPKQAHEMAWKGVYEPRRISEIP